MLHVYDWLGWLDGFNVVLELRLWAIVDGQGFIPKDNPETCHHNSDPSRLWYP